MIDRQIEAIVLASILGLELLVLLVIVIRTKCCRE